MDPRAPSPSIARVAVARLLACAARAMSSSSDSTPAPASPAAGRTSLRVRLLLSLSSVLAFVLLGECVARVREPGPFSLVDTNPYLTGEKSHEVRHRPGFEGRWDSTWYRINGRGMRGPDIDWSLGSEELRVVCLGDSCTFGKGVLEEASWPRQLERLLQEALPEDQRARVANLGINGGDATSAHELLREQGLALRPDLVVYGANVNDFPNAVEAVNQKVFIEAPLKRLIPQGILDPLNRSALYRWARSLYYQSRRAQDWAAAEALAASMGEAPAESPAWARQRARVEAIQRDALAAGARCAIVLFPYESQIYLDSYDTSAIERLAALCAELEIPFIDLAEVFREHFRSAGEDLFIPGDRYHPNAGGYTLVARALLRLARTEGLLEAEESSAEDTPR